MKAFKVIGKIIKGLNKPQSVLKGFTSPVSFQTIATKKGVISYNPTNVDYSAHPKTDSNKFYVYPIDKDDQEHYILFDIIERRSKGGQNTKVASTQFTKREDNLNEVVYGANRFFSEGTTSGVLGIPTGKGAFREVKTTIAIYMPQTLKFNLQADYGAEEIGGGLGALAKLRDAMNSDKFFGGDMAAVGAQVGKLVTGLGSFATGGLGAGVGAAVQRRTGIAPAAMTEMIFNGIDYRTFSFTFKFTPRNRDESDVVNGLLHAIKDAMLPKRYGKGQSIAAYTVPHEFVIRFMKGTKINPYLDQIGLCACTGVEIDYGSDKFSTHPSGDPVSIDATLTFRELELMERKRYNALRISASQSDSTTQFKAFRT